MAGENDDEIRVTIDPALEIEVDPNAGATVKVVDDKTGGGKKADDDALEDLKGQFANLQGQVSTATQRAADAERDAQEARQRLEDSNKRLTEAEKRTVDGGLQAAKDEAEAAARDYERAFEAGDAKAASEAQRKIARAEAKILRLDEAAADLAEQSTRKPEQEQRRERQNVQPVAGTGDMAQAEAFVQTRTPASQAFLRKHMGAVADPKQWRKIEAAHYSAVAEDLAPDTPEYFAHVEKMTGLGSDSKANGETRQRRQAAPAAPGGDIGGPAGGGSREVRLTQTEAKAATDGTLVWNYDDPTGKNRYKKGDPIGVQEFARRKLAMEAEGRYNRDVASN